MPDTKTIHEVFEIENLRVLEAMNNPTRLQILNQLTQPRSVKEVAEALDLPPTRLYYHVNALEKVGVIRVVGTRKVGAILEKQYQVVSTHFRPGPKIVEGIDDFPWAAGVIVGAVLDGARLDAERSLSEHLAAVAAGGGINQLHGTLGRTIGSMTAEKATEFAHRVEEIAIEMANGEPDDSEGNEYAFSFVFFPMAAPIRGFGS
jgi:DNA-binding transcriptional ArsR family regulator